MQWWHHEWDYAINKATYRSTYCSMFSSVTEVDDGDEEEKEEEENSYEPPPPIESNTTPKT